MYTQNEQSPFYYAYTAVVTKASHCVAELREE